MLDLFCLYNVKIQNKQFIFEEWIKKKSLNRREMDQEITK